MQEPYCPARVPDLRHIDRHSSATERRTHRLLDPKHGRVDGMLTAGPDALVLLSFARLDRLADGEEQHDSFHWLRDHREELGAGQTHSQRPLAKIYAPDGGDAHLGIEPVDILELRLGRDEARRVCPLDRANRRMFRIVGIDKQENKLGSLG